ncbi:MAG: hypothetical protein NT159_07485 [Proteobacteria bacterium]|nr:hypothetical protein [Pseudomonadota bacterium]
MMVDSYTTAVNAALLSFQAVEEALKICIGMSYEILDKNAPPPVVFKFNRARIANSALGRLIDMFSEVSTNEALISDLKKIVQWRNFCAHSAFMHHSMNKTGLSTFKPHTEIDVLNVAKFVGDLVERLATEMLSIREVHDHVFGKSDGSLAPSGT